MSKLNRFDRRAFLRSTGMTAVAGAVGGTVPLAAESGAVLQSGGRYDFDTIYSRIGTDSSKWDAQIARYGRDKIEVGMGTADQDFRIAPAITRALRERIGHENYGYLSIPASYKESIVDWNKRRYGLEIDPDTIQPRARRPRRRHQHPARLLPARAARCSCRRRATTGSTPTSGSSVASPRRALCKLVNGRYQMDFEDLERRIDHDTHAFILCNPHNPTGNVWSRSDLMTLGEICNRRRVVVLSDEIHCDFVTKGHTYTPFATLDDEAIVRNSVTFKSVSKSFNLSLMKCAYQFSTNPGYLERIEGVGQHRQAMNTLGIIAAEAAYNECEDWLDQLLEYIDGTLDSRRVVRPLERAGRGDRQAGGNLSGMARRRQAAMEAAGMRRAAAAADGKPDPGTGVPALAGGPRAHPPEPGILLRPGRRRPHADEHRHVAPTGRAGARATWRARWPPSDEPTTDVALGREVCAGIAHADDAERGGCPMRKTGYMAAGVILVCGAFLLGAAGAAAQDRA